MPDPVLRFLNPGELGFTCGATRLKTLLGSCVAVTLWHPATRRGAMCHFMLPTSPQPRAFLDGKYGEDALALLHRHFQSRGIPPEQVRAGIFGGGDVTCSFLTDPSDTIGSRNVAMGRNLLTHFGYTIVQEDVRGTTGRTIVFDVSLGTVDVKRHAHTPASDGRRP